MSAPRTAPRDLAVICLVCVGVWALLTIAVGAGGLYSAVHDHHVLRETLLPSASGTGSSGTVDLGAPPALESTLFVLWFLSLNATIAAGAVGVVHVLKRFGSILRSIALGLLVVGVPFATLFLDRLRNVDAVGPPWSFPWGAVLGSSSMILIALATVVATCAFLGVRPRPCRRARGAGSPAPTE